MLHFTWIPEIQRMFSKVVDEHFLFWLFVAAGKKLNKFSPGFPQKSLLAFKNSCAYEIFQIFAYSDCIGENWEAVEWASNNIISGKCLFFQQNLGLLQKIRKKLNLKK